MRVEDDRAGERHALALTARELIDAALPQIAQLDQIERALDALGDFVLRDAAQLEWKGDIVEDVHMREQGVVLEHHAHAALVRRFANDLFIAELDAAGIGSHETRQHHQERGLPRTGRAEQCNELAAFDVDADVIEGLQAAV